MLGLFFPMVVLLSAIQNGDDLKDGQEATSYLHGVAINAQSVKSFDVIFRTESFSDIAANEYIREETVTRIRLDWEKNRCLFATKGDMTSQMRGEKSPTKQVRLLCGHYTNGLARSTQFGGKVRESKGSLREAIIDFGSVIDFRMTGLKSFPYLFGPRDEFADTLSALSIPQKMDLKILSPKTMEVSRVIEFQQDSRLKMFQQWVFDRESLMPHESYTALWVKKNGQSETVPRERERYQWKQIEHSYLPVRIESTKAQIANRTRVTGDSQAGDLVKFEQDTTVRLHWFKVNQPMSDEDFSDAALTTIEDFYRLVDLRLSGASALAE